MCSIPASEKLFALKRACLADILDSEKHKRPDTTQAAPTDDNLNRVSQDLKILKENVSSISE
ncbi:hypothetical protein V5O48_015608 [Marasmius crinis-equi]|uniref:Uncharacterized protein n=1 Tax=Marasmius crinis-equi TaxID=585013 RepID=A0ABR3EU13_9AGAR